jgi:hypothetical protein
MDSKRRILLAATAAVLTVASSSGRAAAAPTAAQKETARRLMDEGKERSRTGEKERALEAYQKAHDLMKVPTTGMALVRAHLAVGHLLEARDVALEVARMPRERSEPAIFEKARKEAKELEASLKPRIPTVRIVVKGGPATHVTVDDVDVAPLLLGEPVAMNPGKHTIVAKNADNAEKHADVELGERDAKEIELTLPASNPVLLVTIPPPAKPSPDGARGSERSPAANVLVFGGFGLAVAGLAVGGVTGALTLAEAGSLKTQCANGICDPAAKNDLDSASSLATISTLAFAAAGVGLVCGVVGLVLPKTKSESALQSTSQRSAVWVGPGGMGMRGSF